MNTKMKTNKMKTNIFVMILLVIVLGSMFYFSTEYSITGYATTTNSSLASGLNQEGFIVDVTDEGNCEDFGTMNNVNYVKNKNGEKKLGSGTVDFNEEDCKADISKLIKNGRDMQVKGVTLSSKKNSNKYFFNASKNQTGTITIDGKTIKLNKGDSLVLNSTSGMIQKGKFSIDEPGESMDIGPFETTLEKGKVNYDAEKKILELPKGSKIKIKDAQTLNSLMGEGGYFDLKGEKIQMNKELYNGLVSFSPKKAGRFGKFSGDLRINRPKTKFKQNVGDEEKTMKYMASIPKGEKIGFPDAGIEIGASSFSDTHLFFEQGNYFQKIKSEDGDMMEVLGTSDYYLKGIGGRNYLALTDNEISGRDWGDNSMKTITFEEGANIAGFNIKQGQHLKTKFKNDFHIKEGNVYVHKGNFRIENGADKIIREGGTMELNLLGGETGKSGVDFNIFKTHYGEGKEKKLIHGRVGNQLGNNAYLSNFQLVDESLEYRQGSRRTQNDFVGGVKIINKQGELFSVQNPENPQGNIKIDLLNTDNIPEEYKRLLRNQINSQKAPPGYRYIGKF
ncbi:MAG TPA: hypothetical protein VJ912_02425 [Candidatus Nanoarchaeia archaeon]|nr:hypothetical protein [Candidatus Nanoarchaeia archaeon]